MYSEVNCKTKKELKERVKRGEKIGVFQPGGIFHQTPLTQGKFSVEGPHYPQPHKWYAMVEVKEGVIVKVT